MTNLKQYLTPVVVAILTIPMLLAHTLRLPAPSAAGIFISVVILWFSEIISLAATALLVPILALAFGILDAKTAFASFGDPILFLFLGGFLLAQAMEKHGWDKRMAYAVLSRRFAAASINRLSIVVALICWVLSMWISNTATCAIMTPMVLGIVHTLSHQLPSIEAKERLSSRLLLITAFASSIGGMATPVGSPPNLIALSLLKQSGIEITFLEWMSYGVPVSLVMLVGLLVLLQWRLPVETENMQEVAEMFKLKLKALGKLKRSELLVAFAFTVAVVGWIAPDAMVRLSDSAAWAKLAASRLNMGAVALFAGLLLFVCLDENKKPVLDWSDTRNVNWGVIMLFGGGLCLGKILDSSQLASHISNSIFVGATSAGLGLIIMSVILAVILSEFSSNTASAAILVPIVLAQAATDNPGFASALAIAVALGASCGFMLPVSTPPNAIVYGTGELPLKHMVRYGVSFDFMGVFAIILLMLIKSY